MKIRLSVNSKDKNKQDPARLTYGWKQKWMEPWELAAWVKQGYAWAATFFIEGKRSAKTASGSNAIVFDFNGELSLENFWATRIAQDWWCLTYTSASHTEEINRFRAVFVLEGLPLETAWQHKCIYQWLELVLSKELKQEFKDDCGNKPERLWFGNDAAIIQQNEGAFVPQAVVDGIDIPPEPVFSRGVSDTSDITDLDIRCCIWLLENFIQPSDDGEYNEMYMPVTAACAALGSQVENAWVNWVAAGHHGNKQSNMDAQSAGLARFCFLWVGRWSPSSLHRRCTRLWFTPQPSRSNTRYANRRPQRMCSAAISRSRRRSLASSTSTTLPACRWVLRCWPTTLQANRSDTRNMTRRGSTALRRRSGLRSFPWPTPTAAPCLRLEHRLLQLSL